MFLSRSPQQQKDFREPLPYAGAKAIMLGWGGCDMVGEMTQPKSCIRNRWRIRTLFFATTAIIGLVAVQSHAAKDPVYKKNRGKVIFQADPFPAFDSAEAYAEAVSKAARNKRLERKDDGSWTFNFVAFLKHAPKAAKVNLVFYRLREKKPVDFIEYVVQPSQVTLQSRANLNPDSGFKVGDKLDVRITRLIGRREVVYASCKLVLM